MNGFLGILWVNGLATTGTHLAAWITANVADPVTKFTFDYVLLVALATVLSIFFHLWRFFCKMMSILLPKDSRLQQWFELTWQRLSNTFER